MPRLHPSRFITPVALFAMSISGVAGQPRPTFDVTSVKPFGRGDAFVAPSCSQGNFISAGSPVSEVIYWAFGLKQYQSREIEMRSQSWVTHDAFSMQAKSPSPRTTEECKRMVRSLLEDRFKLKYRWDRRQGEVYDLVVAKGGHKLQAVAEDYRGAGPAVKFNGQPVIFAPAVNRGIMWEKFVENLGGPARGIPIVDKTGLTGRYVYTLSFSNEFAPVTVQDPDFVTALRQQLGLILQARKGERELLRIDHIERPGPN